MIINKIFSRERVKAIWLVVFFAVSISGIVSAATTINTNITTGGTLNVSGIGTFGGNVGIGTTSPYSMLSVAGQVVAQYFTSTSTTATSTFAGGVTSSCFSTGSGCLTSFTGLSVKSYGALGTAQKANDCTVVASNTSLVCATSHFSLGDVGSIIAIPYAGTAAGSGVGETFVTTIAGYTSPTTVTLTSAPITSIAGARTVTDVAFNNGGTTVTSATASFAAGDVGKLISIPGAGLAIASSGGSPAPTKIVIINSGTSVSVNRQSLATVSGQTVTIPGATIIWGPDDTTALQNAINAGCAQKKTIMLDAGNYLATTSLAVCSNMRIVGQGPGSSIISPVGTALAGFLYNGGTNSASYVSDVLFANFEIDMSGVRANTYAASNKGIFIRPMIRPVIRDMYIHDCSATCIGVDFLIDGQIINNTISFGGNQVMELGGTGGGACIGIGTGLWNEEPNTISGNHVSDCGAHGIFIESQSSNILSRGIRIINNDARWTGYGFSTSDCIGDHAAQGAIIQGNTVEFCFRGIVVSNGFVNTLYSQDWQILDNYISNSTGGIYVYNQVGGGKISGNTMVGNVVSAAGTTNGIQLEARTGGTQGTITVSDNKIRDFSGRCIWISTGSFGAVNILGNDLNNCGGSTARPAILFGATYASSTNIQNNVAYDSKATKQMSYGFQMTTGTITRLWLGNNDFNRTLMGSYDLTGGTITTLTGPEFTQSGAATLSGGAASVTLGIPFVSSTTARCFAVDITTPANTTISALTSSSTLSLTGTGTDVLNYYCSGR